MIDDAVSESLPDSWYQSELGKVAKWGSGGTPKSGTPAFYGGEIPWAVIGDLTETWVSETAQSITEAGLEKSSAKIIEPGTVMLAMYGASIGRTGIAAVKMATNQAIAFAAPIEGVMDKQFLLKYLQSQKEIFVRAGQGGAQPNISQTVIKPWPVPVPPIAEQTKIVEILEEQLSRLDAALASVRAVRVKATRFRRSLLHAAFTGALTGHGDSAGALPDSWAEKPLTELCAPGKDSIVDGPFGSNLKRSDFLDSGVPVLKLQNIKPNMIIQKNMDFVSPAKFKTLMRHSFRLGDVVMTKLGNPLGVSAIVTDIEHGVIVADLVRVRPASIDTKFLCYQLNSPLVSKFINENQKGTTRPRINLSIVRNLKLNVPLLAEQQKIVEILEEQLSRLDASLALADVIEKKTSGLRRSLLHAAFTGELTKQWREDAHV